MDKKSLSNYGWIVVCIIVIAILIGMATPFASTIRKNVTGAVDNLQEVGGGALETIGGADSFNDVQGDSWTGQGVQLTAPVVNISGNRLVIAEASGRAEEFLVYSGDKLLATIPVTYPETHFDLSEVDVTSQEVRVAAKASGYVTSSYAAVLYRTSDSRHNGLIPVGGIYYIGVTSDKKGDYSDATTVLVGDGSTVRFPEIVSDGDIYTFDVYEYRYNSYFANNRWFSNTNYNGWGVSIIDSESEMKPVLEEINYKQLVSMYGAFYQNQAITSVPSGFIIPDTVKYIDYMFQACSRLTNVNNLNLHENITSLKGLFCESGVIDLSNFVIPSSVTSIASICQASQVQKPPVIPFGVENLSNAFLDCRYLKWAPIIPESALDVTSMFSGCSSLQYYVGQQENASNLGNFSGYIIPSGITSMPTMFKGVSLMKIAPTIPGTVKTLSGTFNYCTRLTSVAIPYGVTTLQGTFYACISLQKAPEIPGSVKIMSGVFSRCTSLLEAPKIPEGVTDINSAFSGCSALTTAHNIPSTVTDYDFAFENCENLTGTIVVSTTYKATTARTFSGTQKPITIIGPSEDVLNEIARFGADITVVVQQ